MMDRKEAAVMRNRILRIISTNPQTSHEIAARLRVDRQAVSNQLKRLRIGGVVRHDGHSSFPKWTVIANHKDPDGFVPKAAPNLRWKLAQQWRGTWLQGMEAVL